MPSKMTAVRRRRLANNPGVHPELRWYIKKLNANMDWGTTTTTTSTTTTTTTTTSTTSTTTTV